MENARTTIPISKGGFSIISTPKMGKLVRNNGSNAQWIAQANEVVIPKASQFTFDLIEAQK